MQQGRERRDVSAGPAPRERNVKWATGQRGKTQLDYLIGSWRPALAPPARSGTRRGRVPGGVAGSRAHPRATGQLPQPLASS